MVYKYDSDTNNDVKGHFCLLDGHFYKGLINKKKYK